MFRRLSVLALAIILMALWVVAYQRASLMDSTFLRLSGPGVRGLTLYLSGRYAEAARAYRAGLGGWGLDYNDDPWGADAMAGGELAVAERRARTTLTLVPAAFEPRLTLSEIALDQRRFPAALELVGELLARDPDHVDALLLSAIASARLGHDGAAITAINRALRHGHPGRRRTLVYRALELAGELAPPEGPARSLCLLAHLHRYLRIYDDTHGDIAIAYARRAIGAGDRPADAYLTLGIVLNRRGRSLEALQAFQQAVVIDRQHAEAYRWASQAARDLKEPVLEYQMARAAFEAAPTDRFYLAPVERVVMNWFGDARTTAALMQRAVDADPANARAHENLARAARALGQLDRAAAHEGRAAELRRARSPR